MLARACARAAAGGGRPLPVPGSGYGVSRVWADPLPEPDPLRSETRPAIWIQSSSWTANGRDCWVEPLQRFRPNRCNLSLGSNLLAPPGALYKALPSLN